MEVKRSNITTASTDKEIEESIRNILSERLDVTEFIHASDIDTRLPCTDTAKLEFFQRERLVKRLLKLVKEVG